jgi:hypothetical protein
MKVLYQLHRSCAIKLYVFIVSYDLDRMYLVMTYFGISFQHLAGGGTVKASSWDSALGLETMLWAGLSGVRIPAGARAVSLVQTSRPAQGPHSLLFSG